MQKRTYLLPLTILIVTNYLLEILQMILKLFPSVTLITCESFRATIHIVFYFFLVVPVRTKKKFLFLEKGSLEVLPVVSIDTSKAIMLQLGKRAEFGLELKEQKIFV